MPRAEVVECSSSAVFRIVLLLWSYQPLYFFHRAGFPKLISGCKFDCCHLRSHMIQTRRYQYTVLLLGVRQL